MAGFEKLKIWREAYDLMLEVHRISKTLPRSEFYSIKSQIERSSASVADNIAEGYSSFYYKDKIKGMYTARKEAGETQNHIFKMKGKLYITQKASDELSERYEGLIKGINAFVRYINEKRRASSYPDPQIPRSPRPLIL